MKKILTKITVFIFIILAGSFSGFSQTIDVSGGLGEYDQSEYPGYPMDGVFYASLTKSTGTIPAGTLGFSISLATEVPYTGAPLVLPQGWVLEFSSPTSLYIVNTNIDWTDNEIFVIIPVRAIKPRSETAASLLVTYDNIGGDWIDDISNNSTKSSVKVVDNPLPVTLLSFKASAEGQTTFLEWTTTSETNSSHFEIQRSGNGKEWSEIGRENSRGESTVLRNYRFTDATPLAGENLYRLKMVDMDNTFAYSRIQSVVMESTGTELAVYPNPASEYVLISKADQISALSLVNLNGTQVMSDLSKLDNQGKLHIGDMMPGMYALQLIRKDGSQSTHKIIIAN